MLPDVLKKNFLDGGIFDDFMNYHFDLGKTSNLMKTDIKELDKSYELAIDLPGFKKDEIKAELNKGYLTVSAANSVEDEEKDKEGNYIRKERYSGSCKRSFYLGEDIKENDISASYDNGILKIEIPKKEEKEKEKNKKY